MHYDEAIQHCIFRFVAGSHAYGTERPDSDYDYRGVFIAPLNKSFELFQSSFAGAGTMGDLLKAALNNVRAGDVVAAEENLKQAMDPEQGDLNTSVGTVICPGRDEELQELRKFFKLAANCNPNIIEFLYVDRLIDIETDIWKEIRAKREMFLSKKARYTFSGYAHAQLKKIKTHRGYILNPPKNKPTRERYGLPNTSLIHTQYHGALLSLPDELVSSDMKDIVKKERSYQQAMREWGQYQAWARNRNPRRKEMEEKYGFDLKHSTHLVRLCRMSKEILSDGAVNIYRSDRDELRQILNGEWSYEKVAAVAESIDNELDELYKKSTLRDKPDHKGISELYIDICQRIYGIKI